VTPREEPLFLDRLEERLSRTIRGRFQLSDEVFARIHRIEVHDEPSYVEFLERDA
jgi:hypothetical protein